MPQSETKDSSKLPGDTRALILDYLSERYKCPQPAPGELLTEAARIEHAIAYGRYDLCRHLRGIIERQMKGD